jgi:Glycosyl hydrolases family 2, sugar binding domain
MKKFVRAFLLAIYLCALFVAAGAQSRSLDGTWQFTVDREGKLMINDLTSVKDWREIQVPLSWNAQFADLRDYRGVAWYRKTVDLQPIKPDQTVLLKFGGVDYFAEAFVNGQKARAGKRQGRSAQWRAQNHASERRDRLRRQLGDQFQLGERESRPVQRPRVR